MSQLIWILTWTFLIIKGVYYPRVYIPGELSAEVFCPVLCIHLFIHSLIQFLIWLHQAFIALHGLSLAAVKRGCSSLWCWDFLIAVVSCCRAQALGVQTSGVVAYRLSISCTLDSTEHARAAVLVCCLNCSVTWGYSWTRVQPVSTALEGELPTTRPPGNSMPNFKVGLFVLLILNCLSCCYSLEMKTLLVTLFVYIYFPSL